MHKQDATQASETAKTGVCVRSSGGPVMSTLPELTWERRPDGTDRERPLAYYCDEYQFAIMPEDHGDRWELWWADVDSGYEVLEVGLTVAAAQRAAAREVAESREKCVGDRRHGA